MNPLFLQLASMDNVLPTSIVDYDSAVRWIYDRIDYERIRPKRTSTHFRLERVERLLSLIDSPQRRIPAVHIAGTKGKGSTAVMLDAILKASGIKTGLYTSPHIHLFEERMRVSGVSPSPGELTSLVAELHERLTGGDPAIVEDGPTYFEVATMLAWMYFDRSNVEIAVLETGLGGRLDCTNVCQPLVTIITAIGLDHTHILGNTIAEIAGEKAGIIKDGIPILTWPVHPEALTVIAATAEAKSCQLSVGGKGIRVSSRAVDGSGQRFDVDTPFRRHDQLFIPLAGEHQTRNAALAVAAADQLSIADERVLPTTTRQGLAELACPLRFELFEGPPVVILDAAHNVDAAEAFIATLTETERSRHQPRVLIFASSKDKDAHGMLERLLPVFDTVILTQFLTNPRATTVEKLREMCANASVSIYESATPATALREAISMAGDNGVVCGTGSIFLAAELRELLIPPT